MAYWRVEPFGDAWRMSGRAAITAAAGFGARIEPNAEDRFLPSYREKPQGIDDVVAELSKIPAFAEQIKRARE